MYAYASGSPATYGCETNGVLAGIGGGPEVYMRGPGFGCPGIMQRGGMLGLGAADPAVVQKYIAAGLTPEQALAEANKAAAPSTGWADVIGAAVGGLASIFTLSTQAKMTKQAQHAADRTAALNAQTAATQAAYFPQVVGQAPAAGGGMGTTMLVVGGLAVAGGVAWMLLRRRRR